MQPNANFVFLVNGSIDLYPIHISQFSAAENWDECVAQNMGMAKAVGGKVSHAGVKPCRQLPFVKHPVPMSLPMSLPMLVPTPHVLI